MPVTLVFEGIIVMNRETKKLMIVLLGVAFIGSAVGVVPAKGERKGDMVSLNLNLIRQQADTIVTAYLVYVPPPYEVLGKDFYRIMPDDAIDGSLATNSLLAIITNVDSWEGRAAEIETNVLYMLFLNEVDLSLDGLPEGLIAYSLVGNWKGIVSLDKNAVEQRAVRRLEYRYGIKVNDVSQEFVDAVKAAVKRPEDAPDKAIRKGRKLSDGAMKIYSALKLETEK